MLSYTGYIQPLSAYCLPKALYHGITDFAESHNFKNMQHCKSQEYATFPSCVGPIFRVEVIVRHSIVRTMNSSYNDWIADLPLHAFVKCYCIRKETVATEGLGVMSMVRVIVAGYVEIGDVKVEEIDVICGVDDDLGVKEDTDVNEDVNVEEDVALVEDEDVKEEDKVDEGTDADVDEGVNVELAIKDGDDMELDVNDGEDVKLDVDVCWGIGLIVDNCDAVEEVTYRRD